MSSCGRLIDCCLLTCQCYPACCSLYHDFTLHFQFGRAAAHARAGQKRWQHDEEEELQRLVEDGQYRLEQLGGSKLDWPAIGQLFGVAGKAARTKHWALSIKKAAGAHFIPCIECTRLKCTF